MNSKKLLLIMALPFLGLKLWAQCDNKITLKADFAYSTNTFGAAIDMYSKALGKAGKDKELKSCINFQIARCYFHLNDYKNAEKEFKKLTKFPPSDPLYYYEYGQLLKSQQRYEEAKQQFDLYVSKAPSDPRGAIASQSCETSIKRMQSPTCHKIENMKPWNTKEADYSPIISNKKNTEIIFTSNREKSTGKENPLWDALNEDFWKSEKDKKGKWSTPVVQPIISTIYSEGSGELDKKFSTLYFSRCFGDKKAGSGCQIYQVRKTGDKWNEPEKIALFPDTFVTVHPSVDPSGKYMIFSSNYGAAGSQGGMDLYVATYDKKLKTFANPKNLGPTINTQFHEVFPYIKADGTLVFSSDNPTGMGGLDLYVAPKKAGDKVDFDAPENMLYPMNSAEDDFGIVYEPGKEAGYFSSNRKGTKGKDDIWAFSTPNAKIILSGTVRDRDTKAVIVGAKVEFVDAAGNKFETTTDQTGFYKKEIPFGVAYEMTASKANYYNDVNRATSHGLDPLRVCNDTNLIADFILRPIQPLEFEIQFVFTKAEMYPQFVDSVDIMEQILVDNPTMVVEIGGYTDTRGSDESNMTLSQLRAKAVTDSLIARGIAKERIVPKGYGESQPRELHKDFTGATSGFVFVKGTKLTDEYINSLKDGTELGTKKFEDAHTFNRRISMTTLNTNYKPPVEKDDDTEGN